MVYQVKPGREGYYKQLVETTHWDPAGTQSCPAKLGQQRRTPFYGRGVPGNNGLVVGCGRHAPMMPIRRGYGKMSLIQ
jgi:hypothetical protein